MQQREVNKVTDEDKEVLHPFSSENNIPIVLLSSNLYVPYLGVYLKSILNNTDRNNNYDIIVLHKEITENNQQLIKKMCEPYANVSVRFYNPRRLLNGMQFYVSSPFCAEEANYRLLTPWILSNYDKAVVTDCDMIAQSDLAVLYKIPMNDEEYVAAVEDIVYFGMLNDPETDMLEYCSNVLKMKNPYSYVNTGVMVLNLKGIRNSFKQQDILKFASENKFRIQEQDIINVFFEGKIKHIDIKWNFYTEVNSWVTKCLTYSPVEKVSIYKNAGSHPHIIHYANLPKPWYAPETPYAEKWWKIARETPFYEIVLARMVEHISQSLIPAFFRKYADKLLPKGSKRRKMLKFFIPQGSWQWRVLKKAYHATSPG